MIILHGIGHSALFGAIFALLFSRWISKSNRAMGLGCSTASPGGWTAHCGSPAWLGMSEMIFVGDDQWRSLAGHVLHGLLLGALYVLVRPILSRR